jgi:hypothetical protein
MSSRHGEAIAAAARLREWLEGVDLKGVDPYDALRSPLVSRIARTPRMRQAAIQAVLRSPLDPRAVLGIRPHSNAKALGIIAAASSRLWRLGGDEAWRELAVRAAERAVEMAVETPSGPAWGYPFDVQVRWAYYRVGTPNAIATVFTAGGLIVAGDILGRADLVERGEGVRPFLDSLANGSHGSRFYSYVPGNSTPIHNANMLVAGLRARIAHRRGEDLPADVRKAIEYSLAGQQSDGSWPYGEGAALGWVDGFHTAYVLCALHDLRSTAGGEDVRTALLEGARFYLDKLFDPDGVPLVAPGRRYPLDTHTVATALSTLARLSDLEPRASQMARRVLEIAISQLQTKDGWFIYRRGRLLPDRIAYLRWSNAHMLNALSQYARMREGLVSPAQAGAVPVP